MKNNILKIIYFNVRSLFTKFKEFLLQVELCHPDVVYIVESWLSSDIQDSEILLPGYQSVRLDRSGHGGGVIMYVTNLFIVKQLPNHPLLELITDCHSPLC